MTRNRVLTDIPWEDLLRENDLSIYIAGSFGTRVLPSLDETLREEFYRQIYAVTLSGFSQIESERSYEDVKDHANDDALALSVIDDQVVGFASVRILPEIGTFFLHGIAIHADFQNKKVGRRTLDALLKKIDLPRVALTTQNPRMLCLLRSLVTTSYPSPEAPLLSIADQAYGQQLVGGRSGKFDPTTFISKDLYSHCLYPQIEDSNDALLNAWFKQSLEIKEGQTKHGFLFYGIR